MFKLSPTVTPKYTASLNKVLEILEQMELAEQSEEDAAYECERMPMSNLNDYILHTGRPIRS